MPRPSLQLQSSLWSALEKLNQALPSRLLDTQGQAIRLSTEFHHETQYATLSHCWGRTLVIQTTTRLLDQYKQNIPFENLSKTFQDALIVCRRLGIRFLWIDFLCIVQDDPLDWEHEAAKMADVYAGPYLNISALAVPDEPKVVSTPAMAALSFASLLHRLVLTLRAFP